MPSSVSLFSIFHAFSVSNDKVERFARLISSNDAICSLLRLLLSCSFEDISF